jgi:predicted oxidoreductase (fatty acid repression mutant protein)
MKTFSVKQNLVFQSLSDNVENLVTYLLQERPRGFNPQKGRGFFKYRT